jgi:hypothetical protein
MWRAWFDLHMKRTALALAIPALLLLAACGSNEPAAEPASTPTSAPNIFSPAAQPAPVTSEAPAVDSPAVVEALATLGATPGMSEYLPALVSAGVASTSSELVAIGMYTPSMCQMKAQMGMSDADAAKHVPEDLASNVTLDAAQAKALIAAANKYVC